MWHLTVKPAWHSIRFLYCWRSIVFVYRDTLREESFQNDPYEPASAMQTETKIIFISSCASDARVFVKCTKKEVFKFKMTGIVLHPLNYLWACKPFATMEPLVGGPNPGGGLVMVHKRSMI